MNFFTRVLYRTWNLFLRIAQPDTLSVKLMLVRGEEILLVKHTYQPHWRLPGGGVRAGERLDAAARREASEELGAELGFVKLLGIYADFGRHGNQHIAVFVCSDYSLSGRQNLEIECFAHFRLDDMPASLDPGSRDRIQEYRTWDGSAIFGEW